MLIKLILDVPFYVVVAFHFSSRALEALRS
jgi:hypothetical protein